ncbi:hypothetical protein HDU76_006761 [Blyttiomyces sp. JEL0837]|nr:hypothetical protein HDU76_006761 [Blyttiomyces sp. JEL0837]
MTADTDNTTFPIEWARKQFPAIAKSDFVYMDNAGGSAVLESVAKSIHEYMVTSNVQLGASYRVSQESTRRVKLGNKAAQVFVNAEHLDEIVMGASTTQLVENLARAMEPGLKDTDEIIISNTDHEANLGPFVRMAKRRGLKLKVWEMNKETHELDLSDLKALLTENTRLVAVTHCSNVLGSVNDIGAIAELVHTIPGAEICVDAVAYAPHRQVDVQALGVDFYVFSWYKVYGPHISILYTRRNAANRLGSLAHFFIHSNERPYSLQPGGVNYELTSSIPEILAYIADLGSESPEISQKQRLLTPSEVTREQIVRGYEAIAKYETELARPLMEFLLSKPDIFNVVGRKWVGVDRVPTISFSVKGMKSEDVVLRVDEFNIAHRLVCGSMGLTDDGIVRVSLVHYNTADEVSRLIAALKVACGF